MSEKVIAEYPKREPGWRRFRRPTPKRRYQAEYRLTTGSWIPVATKNGYRLLSSAMFDAELRADMGYNSRVIDRWAE